MGIIRMGMPEELVILLQKNYSLNKFVETGTYYGNTAIWATKYFKNVSTIEFSEELFQVTSSKYKDFRSVEFLLGDSRSQLSKLINSIDEQALFWLDAHWSGGVTYGKEDQCPLLEEIEIINRSPLNHFILIDDARLFMSPPQSPHDIEAWPNIVEVIDALRAGKESRDTYIVIIEDVIVAVPHYAKPELSKYCQEVNSKIWEEYGKNIKRSNLQKGLKLINTDISNLPKRIFRKIYREIFE